MLIYAVLVVLVLIRAVAGPKIADRLMAINMVGTIGIFLMAAVAVKLDEDYLLDISIIYAMISFVSVLILISVYLPSRKLRDMYDRGETEDKTGRISGGKKKRKAGKN